VWEEGSRDGYEAKGGGGIEVLWVSGAGSGIRGAKGTLGLTEKKDGKKLWDVGRMEWTMDASSVVDPEW
jgi:hypothetical protein